MIVRISRRGTVTLPENVRQGLTERDELDAIRRPDGVIELRPRHSSAPVETAAGASSARGDAKDPDQSWFWTDRWQQMEREADADVAAGRVTQFDDADSLVAYLSSIPPASES